ncbi:hypothetical protein DFP74_6574 [Nocardiopsis sp. Huas11]|uniref:DUF6891 domain-containing protein n=1 Tax=Nocardiopsis sp. Huas11 TaxID=2183912 RepID=UPI000EB57F79|nr:hypothetical protein [Nocardiopsis sp. Huas11]RKS10792.1 hypothetical protein DFP74_6574 [Nocardiopsis sp. Huas11]
MSEVRESVDHFRATAQEGVAALLATGRGGYVDICQGARRRLLDVLEPGTDPEGPQVRAALEGLAAYVDDAMETHMQRQRRWRSRTDSERLTRAFRALDESGIIAREDHMCCDTCAGGSLRQAVLVHQKAPEGPSIRGYAYYHEQDTRAAVRDGTLMVGFGATHEIRRAAVGEEVAETLRAHGLTVTWNGDPGTKLDVAVDWRRRRWGRGAAHPGPAVAGEPEVEVSYRHESPPAWMTHYQGRVTVRELARMVLPWLPRGHAATLTSDRGHTIEVSRDFDLLRVLGDVRTLPRERLEEPLSRWAVGGVWPEEDARSSHTGMLDVIYSDDSAEGIGGIDSAEPMETAAARELVHRLTPAEGNFAVFVASDESCVQMMWEAGPRLWMESPFPAQRLSRGRFVTTSEAEEMVRILADERRLALGELGELAVTTW